MKRLLFLFAIPVLLCGAPARLSADASVSFNEIMYHPATNETALEWVELYNQFSVDIDLSGWSIRGDVELAFPSNAIVRGGGFVLVAISPETMTDITGSTNLWGPFVGRLSNNGGTLRLHNNDGRVVDEISYGTEDEWPVAADGSGVSLAKRDRNTASGPAANWTWSEQVGGTPGADNFPFVGGAIPDITLFPVESSWKYEASGSDLGTGWRAADFNDGVWLSGNAWFYTGGITNGEMRPLTTLFNTGIGTNGAVLIGGARDPHYVITAAAQGAFNTNAVVIANHPAWLANDTTSSWIGIQNPGTDNVNFGGYNYLTRFSLTGFVQGTISVSFSLAADDQCTNVFLNGSPLGFTFTGFTSYSPPFTLPPGALQPTNTVEFRTVNGGTGANPHGFRVNFTSSGLFIITNTGLASGPATYYFRKSFVYSGDPDYTLLRLNAIVDDGAVFYLNGVEVHRINMPPGQVIHSTPAASNVVAAAYTGFVLIPAGSLVNGANVLAVEVHQAAGETADMLFGAELVATPFAPPPLTLAFNEQSASTNAEFWLELHNFGTNPFSLGGATLQLKGQTNAQHTLAALTLGPGDYVALTNTTFGFLPSSGDRMFFYSPGGNRVYDAFVVKKAPRARSPNGTGPWRHPNGPTAGGPNSFVFRDEIVINEILYHHRIIPPTNNLPARESPEAWIELHNRSAGAVNLTGWELDGGIRFNFAPGTTLAAGGYLVVADDAAYLRGLYPSIDIVGDFGGRLSHRSDRIILKDPTGNPADEVRYFDGGRWPGYADGGGASLELRDPHADNSKAEAWAASDESGKTAWQTFTYRMTAQPSVTAGPETPAGAYVPWREFVFGLLGDGECLIDDLSVVVSPTSNPVQYLANGDFENGLTGWRALGNHGRARVITDPQNMANHVLHLVATGPQEHMHNHIETTFTGSRVVTNMQTYEISYRAKHLAGNNLLNTRLYFNRVARTIALPVSQLNGTPGAVNSRREPNIGPTFSQFRHERVVPGASEPVTVSVVAEDPQGVASCQVFWSVNSGPFSSVAMAHQGGGRYTGTIPGQVSSAIVQFYVRAVDALGAAATFPAKGPDSGALYKVNDGAAILALAHNFRIIVTPANTALLHASTNVMSNDLLPCTVVFDEQRAYYDVALHLKGSERGRDNPVRVSYHVEFQPDDLFRGVHPVVLIDRAPGGGSAPNEEILIRHMLLRAGGIPAVQADLCRVLAPRDAQNGGAILAPRFEDEFIETAFDNGGDGTLFELELIYYPTTTLPGTSYKLPQPDSVQGLDITDVGNEKETYRYNFIIKNHRAADDYSRFITYAKSWGLSGAALANQTRQTTDLDATLRAYALVSLCGVSDMYTFGNNHNWLIYLRPDDGRAVYFPWDMDFAFQQGATAALAGNSPANNLNKLITTIPANTRCFYAHVLDHLDGVYNTSYMTYWANNYGAYVGQNYSGRLSYIQQRADSARSQISSAQGGTPAFTVSGTNFITTSSNLVTLTGTAPVQIKTICINGVEYAVTWTSLTAWTLRIPIMTNGVNTLNLVGYDVHGRTLTNFSRTITIHYTGPTPEPRGAVVIHEIMYNSATPDAAFVELFNHSTNTSFDLSGWRLNGLDYTFPPGTVLTNRSFLTIANNLLAYSRTYTSAPPAFDRFSGNLQDNGETLSLFRPGAYLGEEILIDRVRYESVPPWPGAASGLGPSLQLIDATKDNARVANWTTQGQWLYSSYTGRIQSNGTSFLIFFSGSTGDVYIDDITLVTGTVAGVGMNLLQNGDFEMPLSGTWTNLGNHTNSVASTDFAHSGSSSLHIIATGPGSASACVRQTLAPFPTNTPCTVSFWFISTTNGTTLTVRTAPGSEFNGNHLVRVPPMPFSPGAPNTVAAPLAAFPPVWLNEAQPENLAGLADNQGDREPWVEIYNAGTEPVSLDGWYLSTSYESLNQWAFPANAMLLPGEFKVVICDAEPLESTMEEWHTNFRLSPTNGSVALSWSPGGVQILDYLNYADIRAGRAYGDFPDGQPFFRAEFYRPTPGTTNDPTAAPLTVFINEWMAQNQGTLLNTNHNNESDDWFEIHNPNNAPADLSGYFLTDNLLNPDQFPVPPGTIIPPHGFLLVWADGEPDLNTNTDPALHVSFRLEQNGEAIGLFGGDGALIDAVTFGSQYADISEGRYPDGPASQWLAPFMLPTPGAPNALYANRYPALAAIPDATAYVNLPFQFTASATDPDSPPQSFFFTIEAGAPTNATLHPATGDFSWTPTAAQADTTNVITLRVTDNGTPVLRTERTFTVIVRAAVVLGGITAGPGGMISFNVLTTPGKTYRVEYKNALTDEMWTHLPPDHPAGGTSLTIEDTMGMEPQRFYRVVELE